MRQNIEIKARYPDIDVAHRKCLEIGAKQVRAHTQTDTYFRTATGRLKLRTNDNENAALIFYQRSDSPNLRESNFEIFPLSHDQESLERIMAKALGVLTTVTKRRVVYEYQSALINVDELKDLGNFLEIEVEVRQEENPSEAFSLATHLKKMLGVHPANVLSWSYAELATMSEQSAIWRDKLQTASNRGQLFLLDGASCSGKTTLAHRLMANPDLHLQFVPRYCTRKPRNASTESEYLFVSRGEFDNLASTGAFIEWRDFEFGMSYGLPWKQACEPILGGLHALGIMDLGNVAHVKAVLPEAVTILVDAPVETIRQRLLSRGLNKEEQIEERVGNAETVHAYRDCYDYVVSNDEGMLAAAEAQLLSIINEHIGRDKSHTLKGESSAHR